MPVILHDTLTRELKPLALPAAGAHFGIYTCGPTVYDRVHIGNLRTFCAYDLLVRTLRARGFPVRWVMNVTDVDDRTLARARKENVPLAGVTDRYLDQFLADLDALDIRRPDHLPRATTHVPEMLELIRRLEANGHTYVAEGSVYFRLSTFAAYGRLSHLDTAGLKAGARVAQDDYTKEEARDFVLWKAYVPEDGATAWDSPWGRGRPGWHLECSAMARRYLGDTLDIHAGGVDLVFPHHENEIAQSEGATSAPFCRHWFHTAFVNMGDEKMSKRLGNVRTLAAVAHLGHAPADFRYWGLSAHYRQPLAFTPEALADAARARLGLLTLRRRLREGTGEKTGPLTKAAADARAAFDAALDQDLNVSAALAALHGIKTVANQHLDGKTATRRDCDAVEAVFGAADQVFGCLALPDEPSLPAAAAALLDARAAARARRDFAESDRLRGALRTAGWLVEDTPAGARWRRVAGS